MKKIIQSGGKLFPLVYILYSLYPVYIFINFFRYLGKNISLHAFIFTKKIGEKVRIDGGVYIDEKSQIGDLTYISGDNLKINMTKILNTKIGSCCSIAQNLITLPYGHNYKNVSNFPFGLLYPEVKHITGYITNKQIVIEDGVWVGSNVIILGGVTIHTGSVIGAGSIVTKDVPPYSIAVGNPAKVIKKRFSSTQINSLLRIKPYQHLHKVALEDLLQNDIDYFIKKYATLK